MNRLFQQLLCLMIASSPGFGWSAQEELKWLPDSVNGLAIVRVAEIYASPLAKREGWAKSAAQNFANQTALIPPGTELLVFGSEFGISPELPALREYAVVTFGRPAALESLSELGAGEIEEIDGHRTLSLRQGGFLVEDSQKLWRFTAPGGRQVGMKWLRQKPAGELRLSPFLQSAVTDSKNAAHVLVALDLSDALTPDLIGPAIEELPSLDKLNAAAKERVVKTLADLQGISLEVNVYEELQAELRFHFQQSPAALASVAPALLQNLLGSLGASLESAEHWKSAVSAETLVFRGPISQAEVRRILSLFRGQDLASAGESSSGTASPEATPEQIATASKRYYQDIERILNDLRTTLKDNRDNHALWFERSGRTIDGLKILNVDADLLTFGQRVSSSLRYQGQALRTSNIRRGVRTTASGANNLYRYSSTYVGPYGGTYWSSVTASPANGGAIAAEENASAKNVQFSEWKQIEDGLIAIRRTLTERYRLEF